MFVFFLSPLSYFSLLVKKKEFSLDLQRVQIIYVHDVTDAV